MSDTATSKALAVIRRSQGDEDGASLRLQREQVPALAGNLANEYDIVDLGVHTGFSILSRGESDPRIDNNDEVLDAIERLRAGEYDYVVAWDDSRLARDGFFAEWRLAAASGSAEFAFVSGDVDVDSMEHGVRRAVETAIKREEIKKSREAVSDREQRAMWNSRPPVGLEFDDAHEYLVASDQFDAVVDALEMRSDGVSYRSVVEETGLSRGAIGRWIDNVQERARSCRDGDTARTLLTAAPDDAIDDHDDEDSGVTRYQRR
ncbi:recombinase family protein [Halobaculum sp. EA56]|uniref:recombinase family protein n=1 Tax=Halobaculum sp. EA56 TaxID=3421648 RepID=UPI003EBD2209